MTAATQRRCTGCRRLIGVDRRPWCATCEARLPAPVADQLASARRAMAAAESAAEAWLGSHPAISERELEALRLLARGRSTAEIATEMTLAESTVKTMIDRLAARWGVRGRAALVGRGYDLEYLQVHVRRQVAS